MPTMNMIQALNSAMDVMLTRDPNVLIFGEDVGYFGGVFRATDGLQKKHGVQRCFDTPIGESGIVATAIGMGAYGLRPVVEIQFADYIYPAYDQIVSELARLRYRSATEFTAPVTIRTPCGGGIRGGQTHSQSPEGVFAHVSGIKVVMPSNPYDAKGLLITAIRDEDPVIFFEPKVLYTEKCEVPDEAYAIPFGEAAMPREGEDVTLVAFGQSVNWAVQAADELRATRGIRCDVIDPRTPSPLDEETILESVSATGRLVVVDESPPRCGLTADIAALVADKAFRNLKAPIKTVTAPHTPVPQARELERAYLPNPQKIMAAVEETLA